MELWPTPDSALVLSGGLFRNAFQVGVIEALHARGFRPDVVIGVSSGAWNAACLAAGQVDLMRPFWEAVGRSRKMNLKNTVRNRTLFNIRTIIREIPEAHLDFDAITHSATRVLVGATRLRDYTFQLLQLNQRSRKDVFTALMASNLIPGVVGWPISFDGHRFVDGGFTNRVPYGEALRIRARKVIVVIPDHDRKLRLRPWQRRPHLPAEHDRAGLTIVAPSRPLSRPGTGPRHIEAAIEEGYAMGLDVPL